MIKRKLKALSIAISFVLIIPQSAFAYSSKSTSTNAPPGNIQYYSEKNGVRQELQKDAKGNLIPANNFKTASTNKEADKSTNSTADTKLTTKNAKKGQQKSALEQQKNNAKPANTTPSDPNVVDKFSKDKLKSKPSSASGELLVKFKSTTSELSKSSILTKNSLKSKGRIQSKNIELVTISNALSSDNVIKTLKADSNVESVQPNYLYYPASVPTDPMFNQLWGLNNTGQNINGSTGVSGVDISALDAWNTTQGDPNVVVGVIDTGVDINHPDLAGKIWTNPNEIPDNGIDDDGDGYVDDYYGWDFYNNDKTVFDWEDGDNHGTHVSGTIAASSNNIGVVGVAPNVKIMPLKFLGPQGGYTFDAIRAIEYAKAKGVKVLNNSWGGGSYDSMLKDSISNSGALFVAAAGNDSNNNDSYPAYPASYDSSNILSVAAVNNQGNMSYFSNYGSTTVDVAAPGELVLSTVPKKAAYGAGILTNKTLFQGFGLESLSSDSDRQRLMQKSLESLGITSTSKKILLVQDDASNIGRLNCLSYYQTPLTALGYTTTVQTIPYNTDGPSADVLKQYDLVIWFTGNDYFSIRANDESNLTSYLDAGGKLFLSGRDAGWGIEYSNFYQNYLHTSFIDEDDNRTSLTGEANTSFAGQNFTLVPTVYLDYLKPSDNQGTVILRYTPDADYSNAYAYYAGTSMATPHVTGVAALLLSKSQNQTPEVLKQKIMKSVDPLPSLSGLTVTGGIVNAANALAMPDISPDDDIPGVPINDVNTGTLDQNNDIDDVYSVKLTAGETVTFNLKGAAGETTDFDLHLYSPSSTTVNSAEGIIASSEQADTSNETIKYTATETGTYYVDVYGYAGSGSYTLNKISKLIVDDQDPSLSYTGNWTVNTNPNNEGGTAKVLNSKGSVSYTFTGSSVQWTGFKDPKQGIGRVFIDGSYMADVNLYSTLRQDKQVLYDKSLTYGTHTIEIQWAGLWDKHPNVRKTDTSINIDTLNVNTSRAKATAPFINQSYAYATYNVVGFQANNTGSVEFKVYRSTDNVNFNMVGSWNDYISDPNISINWGDSEITPNTTYYYYVTAVNDIGESEKSNVVSVTSLPINSIYKVEDTNNHLTYTGTWSTESDASYSGGTRHITVNAGDKVTIPFTGYSSRITLLSGPDMGTARVTFPFSNYPWDIDLNNTGQYPYMFGADSTARIENGNWVVECVSGKINIDVEDVWDVATVAPAVPTNLTGSVVTNAASLNWNANNEIDLKGYNVYRSTTNGSGYQLINTTPLTDNKYTDATINPGQNYYYIVKAVNYAGLESNASNQVTINNTISAPTGLAGTASGTSVALSWTKHTNSLVTNYKLYRTTTTGSGYQLLTTLPAATTTYTDSTVTAGTTYYYAISAVTGSGYESAKSSDVSVVVGSSGTVTKIEDSDTTNTNLKYTGTWSKQSSTSASGGNYTKSSTTGSYVELTFTGTSIKFYGLTAANRGIASISIDDGTPVNVDCYSSATVYQKLLFEKYNLTSGTHKIKIQVSGTGNTSSSGTAIDIDYFEVTNNPPTVTKIEDSDTTNPNLKYTGTWSKQSSPSASGGNYTKSSTTGSYVELTFTGTSIKFYGLTAANRGIASISIDDGTPVNVDCYSLATVYQKLLFEKYNLASGTHKIKIQVSGTGNASSSGTAIDIDYFEIANNPPTVTKIEDSDTTNPNLKYTGTWSKQSSTSASGGNYTKSSTTGSYVELTFTGTSIKFYGLTAANRGIASISIDDGTPVNVDCYSLATVYQKLLFEKYNLASGTHKIKIQVSGTGNTSSSGTAVDIDYFEVTS